MLTHQDLTSLLISTVEGRKVNTNTKKTHVRWTGEISQPSSYDIPNVKNVHPGYMVPQLVWDDVPLMYIFHIGNVI
jgi:hypothetical protein